MPSPLVGAELARAATLSLLLRRRAEAANGPRPTLTVGPYGDDPVGYARDVLKVQWWAKQVEIAQALLRPPYRVLVKASHSVGKTHLGGGLVNWWFDSFDPSLVLTTAPTERQVQDLLWKEVRLQRNGRPGFRGDYISRLESAPGHFAHGFTARDGEAFQGHHAERILLVFDEAVGIAPAFWQAAETMFAGEGHAWLAIFNPTDTTSQAYTEDQSGRWHTVTMSAFDHPNIIAELAGEPPPFPAAVRLAQLEAWLAAWCEPVNDAPLPTDVEWPIGSGRYLRPGPEADSRVLARWPGQSAYSVWSDGSFTAATVASLDEPTDVAPEIGCDVARFGDDSTTIHVRRGPVSLHHERGNGWDTSHTAGRLKQLADIHGQRAGIDGPRVIVKVDDEGVGGGVVDQRGEYQFIGIKASHTAIDDTRYPNRRSELWFVTAGLARERRLDLSRLDAETIRELRRQAMAPTWKLDSRGRRVVEPKADMKRRLRRSPDDMDALNLAYAAAPVAAGMTISRPPTPIGAAPGHRPLLGANRPAFGLRRRG